MSPHLIPSPCPTWDGASAPSGPLHLRRELLARFARTGHPARPDDDVVVWDALGRARGAVADAFTHADLCAASQPVAELSLGLGAPAGAGEDDADDPYPVPLPADLALTLTPLAAGLTLDALWMGPQSVGGGRRVRLARRLLAIRTLAPWVRWAEPRLAELWDTDAFLGHRIPSRRS